MITRIWYDADKRQLRGHLQTGVASFDMLLATEETIVVTAADLEAFAEQHPGPSALAPPAFVGFVRAFARARHRPPEMDAGKVAALAEQMKKNGGWSVVLPWHRHEVAAHPPLTAANRETLRAELKAMGRQRLEDFAALVSDMVDRHAEVINLIPDCPAHGPGCLPHAAAWLRARVSEPAADRKQPWKPWKPLAGRDGVEEVTHLGYFNHGVPAAPESSPAPSYFPAPGLPSSDRFTTALEGRAAAVAAAQPAANGITNPASETLFIFDEAKADAVTFDRLQTASVEWLKAGPPLEMVTAKEVARQLADHIEAGTGYSWPVRSPVEVMYAPTGLTDRVGVDPRPRGGKGGDIKFVPGRGHRPKPGDHPARRPGEDGSIIFYNADETVELLKLTSDGLFMAYGKPALHDAYQVYAAFREFLRSAGIDAFQKSADERLAYGPGGAASLAGAGGRADKDDVSPEPYAGNEPFTLNAGVCGQPGKKDTRPEPFTLNAGVCGQPGKKDTRPEPFTLNAGVCGRGEPGDQPRPPEGPSDVAIGIAARVWCDQDMGHVVMDGEAARAIATIVDGLLRNQADAPPAPDAPDAPIIR